jgi:MFS family permease
VANRLSPFFELQRDVKIIVLSNTLRSFISAILSVGFALYLAKLGASPVLIGLTFTGRSLISSIRSLGEGLIADRIGRKPILLFTATMIITSGLIYTFVTDIPILIIVAVLFSVGGQITYTPAEMAMLTEKVESKDRTMVFSLNSTLNTVAGIFGSFAAALPDVLQRFGVPELSAYRQIFLLFACVGVVCFVLFWLLQETFRRKETTEVKLDAVTVAANAGERKLLMRWSGVVALDNIGGSFNELINYWFYLRFGVGPAEIGLLNGVSNILATFGYALGFKMAKRFGTIRATVLSRMPIVAMNLITPFLPSFGAVAVARLIIATVGDIDVPLRQSYIMGVTRPESRASSYGVIQVVSRFSGSWGPSISSYMYEYVSLSIPFWGAATFQFASAASMYLLFKDIKPPEERSG